MERATFCCSPAFFEVIFSENSDFLKYWLEFCDRFWPGAFCSSGAEGWELIQVDTSSYLPRTSYFHLINIYSVVGPAAIVVKLNVPSHALHLHLREGDIRKLWVNKQPPGRPWTKGLTASAANKQKTINNNMCIIILETYAASKKERKQSSLCGLG